MKRKRRILIVDDEKGPLMARSNALRFDNLDVITCNRVDWAKRALECYRFDLIITDMSLSQENECGQEGLDILQTAKRENPKAKVILISPIKSKSLKNEAKQKGADEYLDKPQDLDLLLDAIKRLGVPLINSGSP